MSFIADRVVMDGLTFDDILLIPATFRATASKFSKVVICIRSFQQILYHSITAKVVVINIQASEAVIQGVFLYHSSITSDTGCLVLILVDCVLKKSCYRLSINVKKQTILS